MPSRKLKDGISPDPTELTVIIDERGGQLLSAEGAVLYLKINLTTLEKASSVGALTPFRVGRRVYYTRRDLDRYRLILRRDLRDARIVRRLHKGLHPVDVYLDLVGHGVTLADVLRVTKAWAKVGGLWLVEGPPGSYTRWLQRLGLTRIRPVDLRRCIEDMLLGRVVPAYQKELKEAEDPTEQAAAE